MTGDPQPWLASYPDNVNWDAEIPEGPLFAILDESVRRFPQNEAMDFLGKTWSYAELGAMVDRAAAGFRSLGVEKGVEGRAVPAELPAIRRRLLRHPQGGRHGGELQPALFGGGALLPDRGFRDRHHGDARTRGALSQDGVVAGKRRASASWWSASSQDVLSFPKNLLFPLLKRSEIAKVPGRRRACAVPPAARQ